MEGSIFFVNENEQIIPLKEAKYESEDLFQRLIEQYPDILAGGPRTAIWRGSNRSTVIDRRCI